MRGPWNAAGFDRRRCRQAIAAECAFIDERGAVGIRLKPAAAIVRQMASNSALSAEGKGGDRLSPLPCF